MYEQLKELLIQEDWITIRIKNTVATVELSKENVLKLNDKKLIVERNGKKETIYLKDIAPIDCCNY